jgi:hypothetical protein
VERYAFAAYGPNPIFEVPVTSLTPVLRSELAWCFKTKGIRFEESSRRYFDASYGPFFQSLGAIPIQDPHEKWPDWHWKV